MSDQCLEFRMNELMISKVSEPVRDVYDIIELLLKTMEFLLWQKPIDRDGDIKIIVNKMNRIFYILDKKIFSVTNPFSIGCKEEQIVISLKNINLDSKKLSNLKYINSKLREGAKDIDFLDLLSNEYGLDELYSLMRSLLSIEYGYLRYEQDDNNASDEYHPRFHIDINCSNACTFKLGLYEAIEFEWLKNCLDNTVQRKYLHNCSKKNS